jgi:hypothetical protein
MPKTVVIYENALDFSEYEVFEVEDHLAFLASRYEKWPDTGRIYHGDVSQITDVTPYDEDGIERLKNLEGTFHCVIYPGAVLIPYALYIISAILFVAALVMMPSIPNVAQRNGGSNPSPNNELSSRTNRARVNGRIPDIFGQVRSTPDLIAPTYTTFENNVEVEHALMCVGRGQHEVHRVFDGETDIQNIAGASVQVYAPNSPNVVYSNSEPSYIFGTAIEDEFFNTVRSNSINGQSLQAPNYNRFIGNSTISFSYPDTINLPLNPNPTFDNAFNAGDTVTLENAIKHSTTVSVSYPLKITSATTIRIQAASTPADFAIGKFLRLVNCILTTPSSDTEPAETYDLSGTYEITGLSATTESSTPVVDITFDFPNIVNSDWSDFATKGVSEYSTIQTQIGSGTELLNLNGTYTIVSVSDSQIKLDKPFQINGDWDELFSQTFTNSSTTITAQGINYIGPFIIEGRGIQGISANFVALNGLYGTNNNGPFSINVDISLYVQPVDANDSPTGPLVSISTTLKGSGLTKETRATTVSAFFPVGTRFLVWAARTNPRSGGNLVDEVKWRDVYALSFFENSNFGNVTCVRAKTFATAGALSVKERKLNLLVTRQIKSYLGNGTFSASNISTRFACDIFMHAALDPKIGNRKIQELDLESIYSESRVKPITCFNTFDAAYFDYTFDKTNLSFEETVNIIANTVFCVPYRLGNVIKLSFEEATEDSTLLFNHRNKLPGTEVRTVTFGNQNDNDGIELDYVSPIDDAIVTYYVPPDKSAINPKKVETVGIRSSRLAHFHAWRHYNKLKYQNIQVEFDATQEADMSIPTDRILVSDGTRAFSQEGQIDSQVGLVVYTSQKLTFAEGVSYSMFLQLYDGTVQAIAVTPGPVPASATLSEAPRLPLVTDRDAYAQTTFILVGNNDTRVRAFLVTEKITQDNMTSKIRAANYDSRIYEHDSDYTNGLIT